jgi:Glycosyl hydrolases family 16
VWRWSATSRTRLAAAVFALTLVGMSAQSMATGSPAAATVQPSGTLAFAGAPIGQDRVGGQNLVPGTASFTPPQKGVAVTVERLSGRTWKKAVTGKQSGKGKFVFVVDPGPVDSPYTYRARSTSGGKAVSTAAVKIPRYKQVWADEFGSGLLSPEWTIVQVGGGDTARGCSISSPTQTVVNGDSANLTVLRDPTKIPNQSAECPLGQYLNALAGTQLTHAFTYGIFAARIRFQNERGMHGSVWMEHVGLNLNQRPVGGNDDGGPLPIGGAVQQQAPTAFPLHRGDSARRADVALNSCGGLPAAEYGHPESDGAEVDIVEYFGDGVRDGGISNNVYWPGKDKAGTEVLNRCGEIQPEVPKILGAGNSPSNGYHVYSVEWTPTQYIFRTDGFETFRASSGISRAPEYLLMSLLTSDWELPRFRQGEPAQMNVDWVRVWQP